MFKTFNQHTEEVFNDLGPKMQKLYGNKVEHRKQYVGNYDFTDWLKENKNHVMTELETKSLVDTYVEYGNRTYEDIPNVLRSIYRQYDIELPAVEGIATKEYWEHYMHPDTEEDMTPGV
jgi:hypothetical protein